MRTPLVLASLTVLLIAPLGAQNQQNPEEAEARVAKAVREGVALLLKLQEDYRPHRGPRVFRTEEALRKWQKGERERLEAERGKVKEPKEWPYEGVYVERGRIPPGYRVGGTAIVAETLILAESLTPTKKALRYRVDPAVRRGLGYILDQLDENGAMASGFSGSYDVRGWGHAYALEFLVRLLELDAIPQGKLKKRIQARCKQLVTTLAETEIKKRGGWNYARGRGAQPSSFMTASTLLALYRAHAQGFEVDGELIGRALDALERGRAKDGNVNYRADVPPRSRSLPGAVARMPITEAALYLAGRSDKKQLRRAVDAFFEHWNELEKRRGQQGTHVAPYGVAPYYVFYGHTYVALAIELLPEKDRPALRERLRALIWKTREKSGGWNDRIFPRSEAYGTAMVLQALMMPRLSLPPRYAP